MARAFLIGTVAALALVGSARAADVPGTWPPPEVEKAAPAFTELMSGWYLRGDVGYRFNHVGAVQAASPVISQEFMDRPAIGGGFGYKYQWFRADLTSDYGVPAKVRGTTAVATTQPQYSSTIESVVTLANIYLDLGNWGGFTPYVGAGAGLVHLRSRGYTDTTQVVSPATIKKTQFSWAWMAGISFQVSPISVVDIGYRYVDLGSINSDTITLTGGPVWDKLSTQEVRIGFRFLFD
jgi:opacity protein-like surface antigen